MYRKTGTFQTNSIDFYYECWTILIANTANENTIVQLKMVAKTGVNSGWDKSCAVVRSNKTPFVIYVSKELKYKQFMLLKNLDGLQKAINLCLVN